LRPRFATTAAIKTPSIVVFICNTLIFKDILSDEVPQTGRFGGIDQNPIKS